jgi:DNA-binding CsgD family transcriptional regulator
MLLRDAFQLADGLGATPLAGAVERLARRARIVLAVGPGASGPRAAALTLGLSEREVDVLALLALGRTDRELAQELFITEKTAGHHVSHILAKLEVARRGEAAAVAHRIGLAGDGSSLRGAGAGG